jgi:predicted secreted protein
MRWYSVLAIYLLFWSFTLFLVLPYGVRTAEEQGEQPGPGHAGSAPANVSMRRKLLWTTLISAALFGLFWLNFSQGWITVDDIPGWRPSR